MNKNNPDQAPPASILLATDLGARCDRAPDRAVQPKREWRAKLVVLNVIDVPNTPDQMLS